MKKQNQSGSVHLIIIIILVLALFGLLGFIYWQNFMQPKEKPTPVVVNKENPVVTPVVTTPKKLVAGNFTKEAGDIYYGTSQVEGYVTTAESPDCNDVCYCGKNGELCDTVNYVSFNVTKNNNDALAEYLVDLNGDSFRGKGNIGMGCIADGVISYSNTSDANGFINHTIPKADTTKIMASTVENPIVLEITRLKFTSGGGAPACYSHFDTFSVIE